MTVTAAVTPHRRHQNGKVTLATVEDALTALGVNASMRAVQKRIGGSFRDVCAVVNLVRGRASVTVQEALLAGDPKDFGRALVNALRAIETSVSETRATQERQSAQLAAIERVAMLRQARRDETRLLDALDGVRHDLAAIRPDLAKTADKDPMALRGLLAGLEARVLEAIAEVRETTPATVKLPAPVSQLDPELLLQLRTSHTSLLATATQIQVDQQQLVSAVSALHRDLVARHAHHAQRLSDSDDTHQRELAHVHRHLGAVRTDLAGLQSSVSAATAQLVQTQRTQATSLRRTLRELALTQLRAATTTAAAIGQVAVEVRRNRARPVAPRPPTPISPKRRSKSVTKRASPRPLPKRRSLTVQRQAAPRARANARRSSKPTARTAATRRTASPRPTRTPNKGSGSARKKPRAAAATQRKRR